MTAVFQQIFRTLLQRLKHVVRFDGTSAALDRTLLVRFCKNKDRMIIFFPDLAGNQPGNTFMHIRQINNKNLIVLPPGCLNLPDRLLKAFLRHQFSLIIERNESHRLCPGRLRFLLQQQSQ